MMPDETEAKIQIVVARMRLVSKQRLDSFVVDPRLPLDAPSNLKALKNRRALASLDHGQGLGLPTRCCLSCHLDIDDDGNIRGLASVAMRVEDVSAELGATGNIISPARTGLRTLIAQGKAAVDNQGNITFL